jgi:hypothetical protein
MRLSSPAFGDQALIPPQFSHEAGDRPPPLAWSGAPDGSVELILVCDDPDAPGGPFVHWLLAGVDPDVSGSEAGQAPAGSVSGRSGFGTEGYGGPHPPRGDEPHRYRFCLYALPEPSDLRQGFTSDELAPHIEKALATTTLIGRYGR